MRNVDRVAGWVRMVSPSRTGRAVRFATTSSRPVGSMEKVRGWKPRVSMLCTNLGSPVVWFTLKTAMVFSPPAATLFP